MENQFWLITLISIGFLLVGTYYFILGISGSAKRLSRHNWLSAKAEIAHCEIIPLGDLLHSQTVAERILILFGLITTTAELFQYGTVRTSCMAVSFEYSVSGTKYAVKEQLRQRLQYKPGDIVDCSVNPSKPTEASIKVNIGFSVLYFLVGVALIGISTAMLMLF